MKLEIKNSSKTLLLFSLTKRLMLLCVFMGSFLFIQAQEIIYVKPDGNGNGRSWQKATSDLSKALKSATAGTQIWVAKGTYVPTSKNDRKQSFIIPDGVQLFGGFLGKEHHISERDILSNSTILSGEIGSPSKFDNSFNVIQLRNVSSNTIIDGFTISDGFAMENKEEGGSRYRSGAGIFNNGMDSKVGSNPVIRNCTFKNNSAMDGAAIFNNAFNGSCNLRIENSTFIENVAFTDGGAIFNDCKNHGRIRLSVIGSQFEKNKANNGGSVFGYNITGRAIFEFTKCNFIQNTANARGGAIYDLSFDRKKPFTFNNCTFLDNEAYEGENVYIKPSVMQVNQRQSNRVQKS